MSNALRASNAPGFTLVEIVVALALLTVGLLGAARVLAAASAANVASKAMTHATVLAVDKMEQLRALPFDDPLLQPSPSEALSTNVEGFVDRPDATFVRRWAIEPLPCYPDDAVAVRVSVNATGSPVRAVLETIRVRKSPRPVE